ncbi:hypothetical protein FOA52_012946 [Chlamydomonas sp. UWO 241]|nr:hypothetical protein FOA52_012946 [Chlamydomonas sp. UWO 241]
MVQLMGSGYPVQMRLLAATGIATLACFTGDAQITVTIASAGAIPLLVQLLGREGSTASTQQMAAGALCGLCKNADNMVTIAAAASAIPRLMQLLEPSAVGPSTTGPGTTEKVQNMAARTLSNLAANTENTVTIAAAGAIPPLVQLLGTGYSSDTQECAAGGLQAG